MEKVHPLLCTPQAGELEKSLREKLRNCKSNRKRRLLRVALGKSKPKQPKRLPLIGETPPDLLRAMAASENIKALIALGEHLKQKREKEVKKKRRG